MVTIFDIGKRSGSCGRKASDPTPVTVTTGRVAGLHLDSSLHSKFSPVFTLPNLLGNFSQGRGFSNEKKCVSWPIGLAELVAVVFHGFSVNLEFSYFIKKGTLKMKLQTFFRPWISAHRADKRTTENQNHD